MYEAFYGLKEKPFSMSPDPGFLYLSKKHQMALTLLEYGLLNQVGFCVVSGETGSGKTTLLRKLLENIEDGVTIGMITNTHKGFGGLLDWVLSAFGIHEQGMSQVDMHQRFMEFLVEQYAANKTSLLIVDEAQNMTADKLEELRMLSNVNSDKDQVLQVILAGQPSLKETLRLPELMQFAQRIGVDHHLGSLSEEETYGYIQHRLSVAGATREIFTPEACDRIHEYSGGIPRLINLLCDTVMVYGFADQRELIAEDLVDEMVHERMKDSIVPLASKAPPRKDNMAKSGPKRVWQAETAPVEKITRDVNSSSNTETVKAHVATKSASGQKEVQIESTVATTANKKHDQEDTVDSIEQMIFESVEVESSDTETAAEEPHEQSEGGDVRKRGPNTIEVLQPEEPPKTRPWKWIVAAVVAIIISALIFMIGTSDLDVAVSKKVVSNDARVNQSVPVVQEVPDQIKIQLEEAERFRKELSLRQEEDRARMEALEKQAAILQRERDEALANADAEKKKRTKEAAIAKAAAKNEKEAQIIAQKAIAEAAAAEQKAQLLEKLRAEEAARLQRELRQQQAKLEAEAAAAAKTAATVKSAPVAAVKKKDQSFNTDPCASSTARFLSTCR